VHFKHICRLEFKKEARNSTGFIAALENIKDTEEQGRQMGVSKVGYFHNHDKDGSGSTHHSLEVSVLGEF
jgi:hypothetical protein